MMKMHINEIDTLLNENIFLLDVREEFEYEAGHIKKSTLIPMKQLGQRLEELPQDDTLYVYCHSGGRSQMVVDVLNSRGFEAINLEGGFSEYTGSYRED